MKNYILTDLFCRWADEDGDFHLPNFVRFLGQNWRIPPINPPLSPDDCTFEMMFPCLVAVFWFVIISLVVAGNIFQYI